ncbi:MAG: DRTGG domain-containing protein [Candidatus Bathyarchaeia archaeon]
MNDKKLFTPSIYVTSASKDAIGKTALCLGLALNFKDFGLKVGYFKPIGRGNVKDGNRFLDSDALLMKYALELEDDVDLLNPINLDYYYLEKYLEINHREVLEKVKTSYSESSRNKDLMIIESLHEPCLGLSLGLPAMRIAKMLNSYVLFVSSNCKDEALDEALCGAYYSKLEGIKRVGIVFNCVWREVEERMHTVIIPLLRKRKLQVWGAIPRHLLITAPTVGELVEVLGGEVLVCEENLSNVVENFLVGAMRQESAISYFRRAPRKAMITGGDRPDLALAAMETDTSAIILTGNIFPDVHVLAKAKEKGIPVILVPYDTYSTVQKIHEVSGKIKAGDVKRINLAKELVTKYVDYKGLLTHVGIDI